MAQELLKNGYLNNAVVTELRLAGPFEKGNHKLYISTTGGNVSFTVWADKNGQHPFIVGQTLTGPTDNWAGVKATHIQPGGPVAGAVPQNTAPIQPQTNQPQSFNAGPANVPASPPVSPQDVTRHSIEMQSITKQVIDLFGVIGKDTGILATDTTGIALWVSTLSKQIHGGCLG